MIIYTPAVLSVPHRLKSDTGGKPGVWGPQWDPRAGSLALHSKYSIDAWQKWIPAVNLGGVGGVCQGDVC